MPYLEVKGMRLFYERQGNGDTPLVFVHGYACSHEDWQAQVEFFRRQHLVITCDLRGHGLSEGGPDDCSIETFGADVRTLMTTLDLGRVILIGHSMGCRVVLQAYLNAPQRVAGLILVDGSRLATGDPQVVEQRVYQMLQSLGYTRTIQRLFGDMFLAGNDPTLKERILSRALAFPEGIGAALLPRISSWDARTMDAALSRIAVPLLVLQSTYISSENVRVTLQPGVTTPWLELIQHNVPTAWIKIVSGVGHFSMLEAPEAVNQSIAGFISKICPLSENLKSPCLL